MKNPSWGHVGIISRFHDFLKFAVCYLLLAVCCLLLLLFDPGWRKCGSGQENQAFGNAFPGNSAQSAGGLIKIELPGIFIIFRIFGTVIRKWWVRVWLRATLAQIPSNHFIWFGSTFPGFGMNSHAF